MAPKSIWVFGAKLAQKKARIPVTIPIRKLVFEYAQNWSSSANTRTYLQTNLQALARANPHIEVVVRQQNNHQPIIRGFYLNGNEKVIPLNGFEVTAIEKKVQLLLDSSGAKIKSLKRRTVESTAESARGIWSGLHETPFQI